MTAVNPVHVSFRPEDPADDLAIESINAEAFGPGRFARAAYRIREGGPHDPRLSFVALGNGEIVGSVRQTSIAAESGRAILLGPLAVKPEWKNRGIGRELVRIALKAAKQAGAPMVILVGDEPYYGPLGFKVFPAGRISMPRPVDPSRLLVAAFDDAALAVFCGEVVHADRVRSNVDLPIGLRDTTSLQTRAEAKQAQGIRQKAVRG